MASNSETGHAVNISNFKLIIDRCTSFGVPYNPSNADLGLASMTTLWTTGNNAHIVYTTGLQNAKNPINEREILFKPVNKLVTKALNYFNSTKATKLIKKDAKGLGDRIRGAVVKKATLADGRPNPDSVSVSHQSYVQRGDSFKQFAVLMASDVNYAPNENELKVLALGTLAADMKTVNDNIGNIIAPVDMARITRNNALYNVETGMVDVAMQCKAYVKGVFGVRSPESQTISGIKFSRPKIRK